MRRVRRSKCMCLSRTGICRRTFSAFALVLSVVCIAQGHAQPATAHLTATYRHGELSLAVGHSWMRPGSGVLVAEILAPEGNVWGREKRRMEMGSIKKGWSLTINPEKPISYQEIPWQRVHYRFVYDDEEKASLDDIETVSQVLARHG